MLPIERIEVFVTDLTGRLQRRMSSGAYDTGQGGSWIGKPVLVKLHAGGLIGLGQIRPISPGHWMPDTVHGMLHAITNYYGPRLLGMDAFDMAGIERMFDMTLPLNPNARAALDHALHDLLGKALGQPVYNLMGGLRQSDVPLEWSVSMRETQEEMIAEASRAVEDFGIGVLCLKAGEPEGWQKDISNFAAARKRLGDNVVIGIDPNTGWTRHETIQAVDAYREYRLDYLEQPIDRRDLKGLSEIRRAARGVPLMADESITSPADAIALAEADAVDVLCIKPYKLGGLRPAKKVAAIAEATGQLLNVGGLAAFCQLEAAAAAHFYASTPEHLIMPAGEFVFGLGVIGPDPLVPEPKFTISDGYTRIPNVPGLGVEIDEDALQRLTLHRTEVTEKA
ncbi:MAG: N-succinyl-L-Arg/Lys racemase [Alphaproteobacteria bacterium MarineAlpha4_Bin2]|nr:MAG: N-succinyl-L-Arg/Lys racemase [Alphaproteobacteria bacterium MarineAlpha4_Bin2]